jgi:hypothetical protein
MHSSTGSQMPDQFGAPIQLLSRRLSSANSSVASPPDPSRPDTPQNKVVLENLVTDIGLYIKTLHEVTSLRVASQQKRRALNRSRQNVSKKDEAFAAIIRQSRADGKILDQESFLSHSDASLRARDELGPLEDDFATIEFRLVPKEDDLAERGEEIKRQIENLARSIHEKEGLNRLLESLPTRHSHTYIGSLAHEPNPTAEEGTADGKEDLPLSRSDRTGRRLPQESMHRGLSSSDGIFQPFRTHMNTTKSEPLIQQFAPDLSPGTSWTQKTTIRYLDDDPLPKLVNEDDLSDVETINTDIPEEGDGLLLGNSAIARCPFLKELALGPTPHGRRVSFWLLCRLQRSRLEILRLRETIDGQIKEDWKWSDILDFWDSDDAAMSKTPSESIDKSNTNVPEKSSLRRKSSWYPLSEPSSGPAWNKRTHDRAGTLSYQAAQRNSGEGHINRYVPGL